MLGNTRCVLHHYVDIAAAKAANYSLTGCFINYCYHIISGKLCQAPVQPGHIRKREIKVTVQTRHSQNRACGALRRFATIFAHNRALSTTLYVSVKSCEHDFNAYVQGCLNCYRLNKKMNCIWIKDVVY